MPILSGSSMLTHTDCGKAVMAALNNPDIILLGEHTLVVLNGQGQLRWQKRFDYQPVAFTTYPVSAFLNCLKCQMLLSLSLCKYLLAPCWPRPTIGRHTCTTALSAYSANPTCCPPL